MKRINKYIGLSVLASALLFTGCSNFDEINTNPDDTTVATASLLSTGVILNITEYGSDAKSYIAQNALSKYVGYAQEGQMAEQYNSLGSSSFEPMKLIPNLQQMVEYAKGSINENTYKGLAKFIKSYAFYMMTMKMGDIPYSEAGTGADGNYTPNYDEQSSIFLGILNDLKESDDLFSQGASIDGDPTSLGGDPELWRKTTNSFALKILMTLSEKVNDPTLDIKQRFADIVEDGNLFTNEDEFFGLNYSSVNKQPLYSTSDLFTSRTILSSLLVDNLKRLNDYRLFYFAEPSISKTHAGISESEFDAYNGVDVSINYAEMNTQFSSGQYSTINLRYQLEEVNEPSRLLSYAEQQLILAEASVLGWISENSAKNYYESGVKTALKYVMDTDSNYAHGKPITQDYIDNYFTGEAAFASSTTEQLEQIRMQRYILQFMQDGLSSYFEYRRTKYPEFPINSSTSLNETGYTDQLPMRWKYPSKETTYNLGNLKEALNRQFGNEYDSNNVLMWLLK